MRKYFVLAVVALGLTSCSTTKEEATSDTTSSAPVSTAAEVATTSASVSTDAAVDEETTTTSADTSAVPSTVAPIVDDRAPGVSDTEIKIGITYVDLASVPSIKTNHGDYEKTFRLVIDAINADGGINGRTLVPVISAVNPQGTDSSAAACTKLTQDEQVFAVLGFFQSDTINCFLQDNPTIVIGGNMTEGLRAGATVPWFSPDPSSDLEADAVATLLPELGDNVAVVGVTGDEGLYESSIAPALEQGGLTPVEVAYIDTTSLDANAIVASAQTVAEKLKSEGVEQVLLMGEGAGSPFSQGLARTDFRPQLIFTKLNAAGAYAQGKGNDVSVLEGAIAGGSFDANEAFEELGGLTEECLDINRAGGLTYMPASEVEEGGAKQIVSTAIACRDLYLFKAIAERAGEELNFGTFWTAGNNLGEVELPFFDAPLRFGPGSATDGDAPLYTYTFDPASLRFVRADA